VPVDVAVEEPGPVVVGKEANRDIVPSITNTHDIPDNRVVEVVGCITGAADHIKVVPVQMKRVLLWEATAISLTIFYPQSRTLTGPAMAPAGIVSSTLLFALRPYMLPAGTSSDTFAPFKIWSNTGTVGAS
jgi:hypothetical protein